MNTLLITKHIEIIYHIKDIGGYGFGKDKLLYNLKTAHNIRMTLNGSTKGFWIGKRFLTLNKLRPLLIRPVNFNCPF